MKALECVVVLSLAFADYDPNFWIGLSFGIFFVVLFLLFIFLALLRIYGEVKRIRQAVEGRVEREGEKD